MPNGDDLFLIIDDAGADALSLSADVLGGQPDLLFGIVKSEPMPDSAGPLSHHLGFNSTFHSSVYEPRASHQQPRQPNANSAAVQQFLQKAAELQQRCPKDGNFFLKAFFTFSSSGAR